MIVHVLFSILYRGTEESTNFEPRSIAEQVKKQWEWEEEHMGNYRRIYPCKSSEQYQAFFKQSAASVLQETIASKAREEAVKIQREKYDVTFLFFPQSLIFNE